MSCRFAALCGILLFLSIGPAFSAALPALPFVAPQSSSNGDAQKKQSDAEQAADKKAETDLEHAISDAGNDRAALIRNLEDYLRRYPGAPRKAAIYRAIVETSQQLQDNPRALDYAERVIAMEPDDTQMMMLAVGLLEKQADPAGLTRAVGYVDRVLDRTEKLRPDERSARESLADWQEQHDRLLVALYLIRGRIELQQQEIPLAIRDLSRSYELHPNAPAAEKLGEIAEMQHRLPDALREYAWAFALPEDSPAGKVDRRLIREKLGNVWRQLHGSESGLGDAILAAYDQLSTPATTASAAPRNQGVKDLFGFVLRQMDGTPFPLAPMRGKILVLNFWATWCGPCRALEPLFAQVQQHYAGSPDVFFYAVSIDEDESRVPDFVHREKMSVPVLFADGLDEFLGLPSIPVVVVIDQQGRTVYNAVGLEETTFVDRLTTAINSATQPPSTPIPPISQ
jgi:thiol-disulfide isomerase/thioredoxin